MKQNTSTPWYQEADAKRERESAREREGEREIIIKKRQAITCDGRGHVFKEFQEYKTLRGRSDPPGLQQGMVEMVNGFGKLQKENKKKK